MILINLLLNLIRKENDRKKILTEKLKQKNFTHIKMEKLMCIQTFNGTTNANKESFKFMDDSSDKIINFLKKYFYNTP